MCRVPAEAKRGWLTKQLRLTETVGAGDFCGTESFGFLIPARSIDSGEKTGAAQSDSGDNRQGRRQWDAESVVFQ